MLHNPILLMFSIKKHKVVDHQEGINLWHMTVLCDNVCEANTGKLLLLTTSTQLWISC